jgi:hypothetical protein
MWKVSARCTVVVALLVAAALGQDNAGISVRVLRMGFAFDSATGALRPLEGNARSSFLGTPLDLGGKLLTAAVSAKQNHAVGVLESDGQVVLIRLNFNPPVVEGLRGVPVAPDAIFLSPSGEAAALYYRAAGKVELVSNLPDVPTVQWEFDAGSGFPPRTVAVSDDGSRLLLVSDAVGAIEAAEDTVAAVTLPRTPSTANFLAHSHDVLLADNEGQVWLAVDAVKGGGVFAVAGRDHRLAGAFALTPSADNRLAFLVSNSGRGLGVVDLTANSLRWIACDCQPTALHPLDSLQFQLTEVLDQGVWLADAGSAQGAFPLATAITCSVPRGPAICNMRLGPADGSSKITLLTHDFKLVIGGTMTDAFIDLDTGPSLTTFGIVFSFDGNLTVSPNPPTYSLPITFFMPNLQTPRTIPFEVSVPISVQGSIMDITRAAVKLTSNLGDSSVCSVQTQDLLAPGGVNVARNCQQ